MEASSVEKNLAAVKLKRNWRLSNLNHEWEGQCPSPPRPWGGKMMKSWGAVRV
jgi:hypothetical protein